MPIYSPQLTKLRGGDRRTFKFGNRPATKAYNFMSGALPQGLTFARGSNAWYFNSSGVLTQASNNVPRFDYDPSALTLKGLLIEEQRTNAVKVSGNTGAVVGTPGTLPTGWTVAFNSAGLTVNVAGTGTEYGMNYVDIQYTGTSAGGTTQIQVGQNSLAAASNGQIWTQSLYVRVSGGSISGTPYLQINEYTSGSAFIAGLSSNITITASLSRQAITQTLNQATVAFVSGVFGINTSAGAKNFTLRVYHNQIELGGYATSPILTTGSAATRSLDQLSNTSIPWFNAAQGTLQVKGILVGEQGYAALAAFNDNTTNNEIYLTPYPTTATTPYAYISTSGTANGATSGSLYVPGNVTKLGLSYLASSLQAQFSANGNAPASFFASTAIPTVTQLTLGNRGGFGNSISGWLQSFSYWNRKLTNGQLQQATS